MSNPKPARRTRTNQPPAKTTPKGARENTVPDDPIYLPVIELADALPARFNSPALFWAVMVAVGAAGAGLAVWVNTTLPREDNRFVYSMAMVPLVIVILIAYRRFHLFITDRFAQLDQVTPLARVRQMYQPRFRWFFYAIGVALLMVLATVTQHTPFHIAWTAVIFATALAGLAFPLPTDEELAREHAGLEDPRDRAFQRHRARVAKVAKEQTLDYTAHPEQPNTTPGDHGE